MKRIKLGGFVFISLLLILLGCKASNSENADSIQSDEIQWDKIAKALVERSDLQEGETVLLMAVPGLANDMVKYVTEEIDKTDAKMRGALSMTKNQPKAWSTEFVEACLNKNKEELKQLFKDVDLGIMLQGASTLHIPYQAFQEILQEDSKRTIHFHWAGAYDLNGNEIIVNNEKAKLYEKVILQTDYEALSGKQNDFESVMRNNTINISTPGGTELQFEIADRPVTKQDGNASALKARKGRNLIDRELEFPSGAVRVAPKEETVQGKIAFPDAIWNGEEVKSLVMHFKNGKVTHFLAETGMEAVQAELEKAGIVAKSFREFALGFNTLMPLQKIGDGWIPYYGYGAGIVRLSLGNNIELGGVVSGGYVRWNFFIDATVKVGEEVWVENGTLVR